MGKLNNAQRADMARMLADSRATTRIGLVTSYDPKTYTAVVKIQPDDALTGWLPILPILVGNGFGIYAAPSINDQAIVLHLEADLESGMIVGFMPSDSEIPPTVESGEIFIGDKKGSTIVFTNDGNLTVTTNKDLDLTIAGDVNATVTGKTILTCSDVELGASGGKKVVLDGDPVIGGGGGHVQASSTKVKAT